MKYSNNWLFEQLGNNDNIKYLFFWGHQPLKSSEVGKSCFSQWFERSFQYDNIKYLTAEHWMMAEKAKLFNDNVALDKILKSKSSAEAKKLGRQIRKFDELIWNKNKFEIVKKGNLLKFGQNDDLKAFLLNTKNRVLVEASPSDLIWGIGLAANDDRVTNPSLWRGQNLLGYTLMEVRDILSN